MGAKYAPTVVAARTLGTLDVKSQRLIEARRHGLICVAARREHNRVYFVEPAIRNVRGGTNPAPVIGVHHSRKPKDDGRVPREANSRKIAGDDIEIGQMLKIVSHFDNEVCAVFYQAV